LVDHFN